jgi:hypothetical protein
MEGHGGARRVTAAPSPDSQNSSYNVLFSNLLGATQSQNMIKVGPRLTHLGCTMGKANRDTRRIRNDDHKLEAFGPFSRTGTTTNANRGFRRSSLISQHELEGDEAGVPPTIVRATATAPGCFLDGEETYTLAAHAELRRRGERGCGRLLWARGTDANSWSRKTRERVVAVTATSSSRFG